MQTNATALPASPNAQRRQLRRNDTNELSATAPKPLSPNELAEGALSQPSLESTEELQSAMQRKLEYFLKPYVQGYDREVVSMQFNDESSEWGTIASFILAEKNRDFR